mgnify:CR=1 FL=1
MRKTFLRLILIPILILLIIINLSFLIKKEFLGYRIFVVQTGSMSPTLEVGDYIIIKKQDSYSINDIITYKLGNSFITHRIVSLDPITTKGDNNNTNDEPIKQEDIVGKYIIKLNF